MLFPTIKKVTIQKDELIAVKLYEGEVIAGVVDDIMGDSFWLRTSKDPRSKRAKFSFKIDQVIKLD